MSVTRTHPRMTDQREVELRTFYASCGLSPETIEKAIEARRNPPEEVRTGPLERKRLQAGALKPASKPARVIIVRPGIAYRKLAESCLRQSKTSPPKLAKSLARLAELYLRTAKAIQMERKKVAKA
jgi:hypothetical protein